MTVADELGAETSYALKPAASSDSNSSEDEQTAHDESEGTDDVEPINASRDANLPPDEASDNPVPFDLSQQRPPTEPCVGYAGSQRVGKRLRDDDRRWTAPRTSSTDRPVSTPPEDFTDQEAELIARLAKRNPQRLQAIASACNGPTASIEALECWIRGRMGDVVWTPWDNNIPFIGRTAFRRAVSERLLTQPTASGSHEWKFKPHSMHATWAIVLRGCGKTRAMLQLASENVADRVIYIGFGCAMDSTGSEAGLLRKSPDDVETWERIIYRRVLAALLIPVQLSSVQALKVPNLRAILDVDDVPLPSRTSLVSGIAGYLSGKANGNLYSVVIGVDERQSPDERGPRQPAGSGRLVMRVRRELQHEVYLQAPNVMLLPLGTGTCADVFDDPLYGTVQCIETNTDDAGWVCRVLQPVGTAACVHHGCISRSSVVQAGRAFGEQLRQLPASVSLDARGLALADGDTAER
mgnify:CR=1 FL=1